MTPVERLSDALEFFGGLDPANDPPAVIVWYDEAHSGPGWYVYSSEYPGECSYFVTGEPDPFPELLKALQPKPGEPR